MVKHVQKTMKNIIFGAEVMGCEDLGVQALWEYVYGPSGRGPGAPLGPGKPEVQS